MDEGLYFSDESMREREPLLFQQYIGDDIIPSPSNHKTLSETILQNVDEFEVRTR